MTRKPAIANVWSVLREPLTNLSFSEMKRVASAAGLPTVELNSLTQAASSRNRTTKAELADAIDRLFLELPANQRDRVTAHLLAELLNRGELDVERITQLLERVGWTLDIANEPVPLSLRVEPLPRSLPPAVESGLVKALRRYRDGDLDGAMTAVVAVVDTRTEEIYSAANLPGHKKSSYQQRAITAHATRETQFRTLLAAMESGELDRTWQGQCRAVNGAADVLAAFRRNYADVHGSKSTDPALVETAWRAAVFVLHALSL